MSMIYNLFNQLTNVEWVSMMVSGMFGLYVLSRKLKGVPQKEKITDALFLGGLIVIFIWKLSPLIFQPGMLVDNSINLFTLLLSIGTEEGFYLGLVVSILFIGYRIKKQRLPQAPLFEELPFGMLAAFIAYAIIRWQVGTETYLPWGVKLDNSSSHYHPISLYQILLCLTSGIVLLRQRKKGKQISFSKFILWFSIGEIIITIFMFPKPYLLGLSMTQIFFLLIAGISLWDGWATGNEERGIA